MSYSIREAKESDAEGIVRLFTSNGNNPYQWTKEKWLHFYRDYPEGKSFGIVAEKSGKIIGHYGVNEYHLGPLRAANGMHAFVDPSFRGLELMEQILFKTEKNLIAKGVDVVTAFANHKFALVKEKLLRWEYPFNLEFSKCSKVEKRDIDERPYRFRFPEGWFTWRFGEVRKFYISRYFRRGEPVPQLLKCPISEQSKITLLPFECECFGPNSPMARKSAPNGQPFLIRRLSEFANRWDLSDPNQWYIEMGDSDSFIYKRW